MKKKFIWMFSEFWIGILITIFVILALLFAMTIHANAQSVTRKGNTFYQQSSSKKTIQKDSAVILTKYTYVINDVKYPVYMSSKGSYFIIRTKKDGSGTYRKYVTKEIKQIL